MNLQKILYLFCFGFGFVSCAQVASAEVSQHKYNVYVSGLKVGELDYAVNTKGSAYSIRALMRSTGIVGAFKKYRYEGLAMGRTNNGRFSRKNTRKTRIPETVKATRKWSIKTVFRV